MSTEKKLTAVEWLDKELDFLLELYPSEYKKLDELINQAKELEKQQIIDAYRIGKIEQKENSEHYYNETYKK